MTQGFQATTEEQFAFIDFDKGRALLHLAEKYPTLLLTVCELVQNSIDKDARANRVWISINFQTRHLAVRDNGNGVSVEKFNEALKTVSREGRKGEGSLGQFSIGLISPLGKCERFDFTSCPAPHTNRFKQWTFSTKDIVAQKHTLRVPVRDRPDLTTQETRHGRVTHVKWRSEMSLTRFTEDSVVSRITMDTLVGAILDRFANTMRRNKTVISVEITSKDGKVERRPNVTALAFQGCPLPEQTFEDPNSGKTIFRLFSTPKTAKGKGGRVSVGVIGDDFRFPFHIFARSASAYVKEEAINALKSGLFEGEIVCERVKLHPDRMTFYQNEAFVGMCIAIEGWFDKVGSSCMEDARNSRQEQRFQDLGLRSMKVLEHLLNDPAHATLREVISSFKRGTIGEGHTELRGSVVGTQDEPSVSVEGRMGPNHVNGRDRSDDSNGAAKKERPHTPLTVVGPRGRKRQIVKNSSFGLQFAHEAMGGSPELWKLDTNEGVLTFNIRHPLWVACEERDSTLMRLQECVAIQALVLETMQESTRMSQRHVLDEFSQAIVPWLINGDKVRTVEGKALAQGKA